MTDQVSVRLAVVGGAQFRQEMQAAGAGGARALNQVQTAAMRTSPALQAVTFQASQMLGTMAGGSPAVAALAAGLGRVASVGGVAGLAAGALVTVAGSLVGRLFDARRGTADLAAEMTNLQGSTGAVSSALSAVEAAQKRYVEAIAAQGGASSAAAAAVVASSAREFEARKKVLRVEIELLRMRGSEQRSDLGILEDNFRRGAESAVSVGQRVEYPSVEEAIAQAKAEDAYRLAGVQRPKTAASEMLDSYMDGEKKTILSMRKLRAEAELTEIALEKAGAVLDGVFTVSPEGGGTTGGTGKGGGGGGGKAVNDLLAEARKLFDETRTGAERYEAQVARLNELLRAGAIDQDTYNRKLAQLKTEFESAGAFAAEFGSTIKSGLSSLFDAIIEGGGKAGDVIDNLGKRLLSMAAQRAVFELLAGLSPGIFGKGGFVPLVGSAQGNLFEGGRLVPFAAGGVVSGPTLFPMRGATGLMGEAGPEAIMPLRRINGRLGVEARAGGGGGTVVQVVNVTGQPAREERSTGPDGREMVRVIVGEEIARGSFAGQLRARHGIGSAKVRR